MVLTGSIQLLGSNYGTFLSYLIFPVKYTGLVKSLSRQLKQKQQKKTNEQKKPQNKTKKIAIINA